VVVAIEIPTFFFLSLLFLNGRYVCTMGAILFFSREPSDDQS